MCLKPELQLSTPTIPFPAMAAKVLSLGFGFGAGFVLGKQGQPNRKPCLEHMQRCPGLLVAFSLSLVSFKIGGHKPETMLRTSAAQAMGTFTPAARVLSWSSGQLRTPENPDNPERKLSIHAVSLAANILSCTFSIQMLFGGGLIFQTPAQNL